MTNENPSGQNEGLSAEEQAMYDAYMESHPVVEIPEKSSVESESEVAALEAMFTSFAETHDMEALYAITSLSDEEAANHPVREPARVALKPIVALLNTLKDHGQYEALKEKYKYFSRAVGMRTSNDEVDHTR
jgi:hypothetical protein